MDPLTQFIIGMGLQIVGNLFMPKPEKPKKPSMEDFKEPTSDPARPIPVIFGTVEVKGLNALWSGDKAMGRRDVKFPMEKK